MLSRRAKQIMLSIPLTALALSACLGPDTKSPDRADTSSYAAAALLFHQAAYRIQVAAPVFSPPPVAPFLVCPLTITLTSATDGATIYYTIDGPTPTEQSPALINRGTYDLNAGSGVTKSYTIQAIAEKQGMRSSSVTSVVYSQTCP